MSEGNGSGERGKAEKSNFATFFMALCACKFSAVQRS